MSCVDIGSALEPPPTRPSRSAPDANEVQVISQDVFPRMTRPDFVRLGQAVVSGYVGIENGCELVRNIRVGHTGLPFWTRY